MTSTESLSYLTADEPGIGGAIKQRPEDFVVEEIPQCEPEGRGDHLYLYVEKRRRLTTDVVRFLSQHFRVSWRNIGYAGLKDKQAVTRQWFSVEHVKEEDAVRFENENVQVLDVARHPTKLKRGYLRGNRFQIKVRGVDMGAVVRARRAMERLSKCGVPSFFGEQRFGYKRNNHQLGRALLLGDDQGLLDAMLGGPEEHEGPEIRAAREAYDAGDYAKALSLWPTTYRFERQAVGPLSRGASARDAVNGVDKPHLLLLVSAFQSAIFNEILDRRVREGYFSTLRAGDVACKHDSRGVFTVEDPAVEQPRCDAMEISPTGPMWGRKMARAGGDVGREELEALQAAGVTEDVFTDGRGRFSPDGSRRAMRMLVREPSVSGGADEHGPYVELGFELSRGCYATTLLREIMKNDTNAEETEDE